MTINCMEDNTKVKTPDGHIGRFQATRRERQLISDGKLSLVNVKGSDGLTRQFHIEDLEEVIEEVKAMEDIICSNCENDSFSLTRFDGSVIITCNDCEMEVRLI